MNNTEGGKMKLLSNFCLFISKITSIDKNIISSIFLSVFIFLFFIIVRFFIKKIIKRKMSGRGEYILNQTFRVFINVFEVFAFLLIWIEYIKDLLTLISLLSAAITIALREIILNFFCGIYIKTKKTFKVEDRIQIEDIKGDVMKITTLDFELLEVSSKEDNGQSTGVVVTFPNSIVLSKPIKNVNKGFKYVWDELKLRISLDKELDKNKKELYRIINNIETIKSIPQKMKKQVNDINFENRVYFNKYEPIIYTKIVNNYVELTIRYLMHPKKSRFVESEIWNKIYEAYKEKRLDLYIEN